MGFLIPFMMAMGTGLQVAGQLQAGEAEAAAGRARQQARNYEAAQLNQQAGQVVAYSQRVAQQQRREGRLVESRALALAAASGAGASDPTVTKIIADIAGEGAYRARVALYEGEERARALRMQAESDIYTGDIEAIGGEQRQQAYQIGAVGSLASGAGSLYAKYGMNQYSASPVARTGNSVPSGFRM